MKKINAKMLRDLTAKIVCTSENCTNLIVEIIRNIMLNFLVHAL